MTNKNSNSFKCRQCGMINWATDESCRRCHQLLGRFKSSTETSISPNRFYLCLIIFITALVIPLLVAKVNLEVAAGLAGFSILAALVIWLYCNVSLWVAMFRVSIVWGLAGIFLAPLSTLLFAVMYWDRARSRIIGMLMAFAYCGIVFFVMLQMAQPKVAQNSAKPEPTPLTRYLDQTPTPKPDFLQPREDLLKKKPSNK